MRTVRSLLVLRETGRTGLRGRSHRRNSLLGLVLGTILLSGCGLGFGIDVPSAESDGASPPTGSPNEGQGGNIDVGGPSGTGGQTGSGGATGGSLSTGGALATGGVSGAGGVPTTGGAWHSGGMGGGPIAGAAGEGPDGVPWPN